MANVTTPFFFLLQYPNFILHNVIIVPMHYALCSMHLTSLCPIIGPIQMPCITRFMHYYIMLYEIVYCSLILAPIEIVPHLAELTQVTRRRVDNLLAHVKQKAFFRGLPQSQRGYLVKVFHNK
jgi:hypothetical protein